MKSSETLGKLGPALAKAQGTFQAALKDSANPFFKSKFADLGSVIDACLGSLNANGISVLQPHGRDATGGATVETVLLHESGEWLKSETPIICAKQNDPQALGSAISYARRYGLQSLLSLKAEDDDGEKSMNRSAPPQQTYSAPKPSPTPAPVATVAKPVAAPAVVAAAPVQDTTSLPFDASIPDAGRTGPKKSPFAKKKVESTEL